MILKLLTQSNLFKLQLLTYQYNHFLVPKFSKISETYTHERRLNLYGIIKTTGVQCFMILKMHCLLFSLGFCPSGRNYIRGWITEFLEGANRHGPLYKSKDFSTGLVTVPLFLNHPSGAQDTAALVAGMLGFTVHRTDTSDEVTVQPFQGWALMLANDSPFL